MRKHVLIILCALLLIIGCKLFGPEIRGVSIDKIREAREFISLQSSRARIVSASGVRENSEFMTDPEMTEVFRFIATVYDPYDSVDSIWELVCVDDEWNIITDCLEYIYDGIVVSIDLEDIEMDVCDAWDLITEEYSVVDSFYTWSLYQPVSPECEHPIFVFAIGSGAFFVDAITSEITSMIFEPH